MKIKANTLRMIVTSITILVSIDQVVGLRILGIFPINSRSHYAMCERLMKGLAAKGHQVDVYNHFPLKKSVPNFKDFSLAGSLPDLMNNMSYETISTIQKVNIRVMRMFGVDLCKQMDLPVFQKLLKNPPEDPPYDLVIVEGLMSHCFLAWGRYLNVPMINLMPNRLLDWQYESLGNPMNSAVNPSVWWGLMDTTNFWHRLSNTIFINFMKCLIKFFIYEQDEYVEKYFGPGYPDAFELQKDQDLMLINSHISLDESLVTTPAVIPIAGIHIVDDDSKLPSDLQKWLDDSKDGCVYVSFGSMVKIETFPKYVMESFYASFRKISPIRVLMKIAKPEELIPGLPENVMTKSWLPQEQILKHANTKLFVTHGGLMSGQESIYYGVPMIGIPMFGDQELNVVSNVKRGISAMISLEDISEKTLTSAVTEILKNPKYKKNIEKLSKRFTDRPKKPLDEAVYWVEYVARHGKGCLRSPLVDMPWYQANLLDVYIFIILIIVVAFLVVKIIIKTVIKLCCSQKKPRDGLSKKKR